mgnify:CR=1 FL=1
MPSSDDFYCLRLFDSDNLVLRLCRHRLIFAACPAEALTNLYGISNRSLMAHLFYHKPLQYTVIYIIMDALLVGAWEIIALAVSVATRNPLQPALFPFLLYLILYFICNWLQMDSVSLFCNSVALPACGQCEMGYDCNLLLSCPHRQHDHVFLEAE